MEIENEVKKPKKKTTQSEFQSTIALRTKEKNKEKRR